MLLHNFLWKKSNFTGLKIVITISERAVCQAVRSWKIGVRFESKNVLQES